MTAIYDHPIPAPTFAACMAAYEVVRSIVEADINGTPRPDHSASLIGTSFGILSIDFDVPQNEVYGIVRDAAMAR